MRIRNFCLAAFVAVYALLACDLVLAQTLPGSGGCSTSKPCTTNQGGTGAASLGVDLTNAGGVLSGTAPINAQGATTSYTVGTVATDMGGIISFKATSIATVASVSLRAAGTTGFESGKSTYIENLGKGLVTVTVASGLINDNTSINIYPNSSAYLVSDGMNYSTSLANPGYGNNVAFITDSVPFANPITINGINPNCYVWQEPTYHFMRIGCQYGGNDNIYDIAFEFPSGSGFTDAMILSPTSLAPAAGFNNTLVLGFAGQGWKSIYSVGTIQTAGNNIIISTPNTPADNATCTAGTIWWDASNLYVCTASGTVKRSALSAY